MCDCVILGGNERTDSKPQTRDTLLRIQLKAMATLSFMTSPSRPVVCTLPLPGISVASTNSTSPPVVVHAMPVATPTGSGFVPALPDKMGLGHRRVSMRENSGSRRTAISWWEV